MISSPLTTLTSSNIALSSNMRRVQAEAARVQAEVASGRLSDVGAALGSEMDAMVALRQQMTALESTVDANNQLAVRLDASQAALGAIIGGASEFLGTLMAARSDPRTSGIIADQAANGLSAFVEAANTSFSGVYVFSGLAFDTPPMSDYFATPTPASRSALQAAFVTEFGISTTDPAVASITVSSMQAFLDNSFDALFSDAGWSANWTTASVETVSSLISEDRTIPSSVSAQNEAFRKIAAAYVMVADAGTTGLNEAAYEVVIDKAVKTLGEGIAMMGELQSVLGTAQQQVDVATSSMSARIDLATSLVGEKEGVDLSELSVRLSGLLNQLEATYAVTGRLQRVSLLDAL